MRHFSFTKQRPKVQEAERKEETMKYVICGGKNKVVWKCFWKYRKILTVEDRKPTVRLLHF